MEKILLSIIKINIIIYQNKEYELKEYLNINSKEINDVKLEIKLILLSNLTDMSNMFH